MKRIIIVCTLVLFSIASMAGATLSYFRVDPVDVMTFYEPDDLISIQLFVDQGPPLAIGFAFDQVNDDAAPTGQAGPPIWADANLLMFGPTIVNAGNVLLANWSAAINLGGSPVGGAIAGFEYKVPDVGGTPATPVTITIFSSAVGNSSNSVVLADGSEIIPGSVGLRVVPEPMTISLLGLGVLGLLRRYRKT